MSDSAQKSAAKKAPAAELSAEAVTRIAARAADDKHGVDILALEVREMSSIADYFLLVSGRSTTQVDAIYEAIDEALSREGREPLAVEGKTESRWILMDYADVVVHIFLQEARVFYGLERLWGDAPELDLDLMPPPGASA